MHSAISTSSATRRSSVVGPRRMRIVVSTAEISNIAATSDHTTLMTGPVRDS